MELLEQKKRSIYFQFYLFSESMYASVTVFLDMDENMVWTDALCPLKTRKELMEPFEGW